MPGADGWPEAYEYTVAGRTVRFDQTARRRCRRSCICRCSIRSTIITASRRWKRPRSRSTPTTPRRSWNKALLDNAARPSGALVYDGRGRRGALRGQFERLKRELEDNYQGARNAGRPLLLEGGLDWKAMSLSPKDMDFMERSTPRRARSRSPSACRRMLLGIPGDNTYSNYQEANRVFWRATVLPLAARIGASLAQWLAPAFGEGSDARDRRRPHRRARLRPRRAWERVTKAPFLTLNEKRAAVGYGPVEGGDRLE